MKLRFNPLLNTILAFALIILFSCKKDQSVLGTGGKLLFSVDTLSFDTVFTQMGSFTTLVKIYNPQASQVNISNIRLQHGSASFFHLNIDGASGNTASNIKIAGNDSIYVFATIKVDPNSSVSPFLITDSLIATMNGAEFVLPMEAFGQNANYVVGDTLDTQTWDPDLPYVIIHSAQVNPGQTLTIKPGCRIYMHADSRLIVSGTLIAKGTLTDSIIFRGDRLDRAYFGYEGYPGEWGGLYFDPHSSGSILDYVLIENCGNSALNASPAAIETVLDSVNNPLQPQLTLLHTVIQNSIGYGILNYAGTVVATNCLINTCGSWCFANLRGGTDSITNCTFVNYGTNKVDHSQYGTVALLNYVDTGSNYFEYKSGNLNASFRNCIIYGSLENELYCNQKPGSVANISLQYCIAKADSIPVFVYNTHCMLNADPLFKDVSKWDYHCTAGSLAIDAGITVPLSDDLEGKPRPHGVAYDLGCYEYQN